MSARLVRDSTGRARRAIITTPVPTLELGAAFRVLGDAAHVSEPGFYIMQAEKPSGQRRQSPLHSHDEPASAKT